MRESQLVTSMIGVLRQRLENAVIFKVSDSMTAGIPDVVVIWKGVTCWIEVKLANPTPQFRPLQHLNLYRINQNGESIYAIFKPEKKGYWSTSISLAVGPEIINRGCVVSNLGPRPDYAAVAAYIEGLKQ